jgi:hypothetical protein
MIKNGGTQHSNTLFFDRVSQSNPFAERRYAECRCAERRGAVAPAASFPVGETTDS